MPDIDDVMECEAGQSGPQGIAQDTVVEPSNDIVERLRSFELRFGKFYPDDRALVHEAATYITHLHEEIERKDAENVNMRRAFRRIAQGCSPKAARDIASSWATEPLCTTHGTPFISPGICPFCDEEARAALSNEAKP